MALARPAILLVPDVATIRLVRSDAVTGFKPWRDTIHVFYSSSFIQEVLPWDAHRTMTVATA